LAEEPIDEADRTILRRGPAGREKACIVKSYDAILGNKRRPVLPVALDGLFLVIPVNEQEIYRQVPFADGVIAEGLDPSSAPVPGRVHGPLGRAFQEIKDANTR